MPLTVLLTAAALAATLPADPKDTAVLAAAQAFFDGMAAGDVAAMRAAGLPDMRMTAVSIKPDGASDVSQFSFEDSFAKRPPVGLKEWMWSPVVYRRGPLATVTAPYEIAREGKTIHCGVDIFTLARTAAGWKIASISWTAEPKACPELRAHQ